MKGALRVLFPPRCLSCGEVVAEDGGLCGPCWRETQFCAGLVCDQCGAPLPGEDEGHAEFCDDCRASAPPWARGRAALVYGGTARRLVLALKHGDRLDLARPLAQWMARVATPILDPEMIATPVPLHRTRLLTRRFNQSALLSAALARITGIEHCPDLLHRPTRTRPHEGMTRAERFENMEGAIAPLRPARIAGRKVLLVDDVMTSGATLAAASAALIGAGAASVSVLVLARVAKDR